MLIKFQFSTQKGVLPIMRVLADIINTPSVTSIAALRTRATAASYDSSLLQYLDDANSYIYRTNDPTNVVAHISGSPSTYIYYLTLQFSVFDNTSTKYYTQFYSTGTTSGTAARINTYLAATAISGGTINSSAMPVTTAPSATQTGTILTPSGTSSGSMGINSTTYTGIYTFWFYINNNGCVMAINTNNNNLAGWPAAYNDGTLWCGPYISSQYTRDDYTNGEFTNNFTYPVMYSNDRGTGQGFGMVSVEFQNALYFVNPLYATSSGYPPFSVLRLVYNPSATDTASPSVYTNQRVGFTIDGFSASNRSLAYENYTTTSNSSIYRRLVDISNTGYKIPNATLATPVFGQHDIGWEMSYYGCWGGSMSQLLGVYLFNGDYSPGDEYTIGGITYMIWPLFMGYTGRLGLAIPKA